jgi:hypothetical protein
MNSIEIYRTYANDYLTADTLAADLGLTRDEVLTHIELGRAEHDRLASELQQNPPYLNLHGWSDVHPYEVISITTSGYTATVRAMQAELDPSWRPEVVPGGFAGHCVNNVDQRWIITPDPEGVVLRVRRTKKGWRNGHTRFVAAMKPRKFRDYNF